MNKSGTTEVRPFRLLEDEEVFLFGRGNSFGFSVKQNITYQVREEPHQVKKKRRIYYVKDTL